MRQRGGLHVLLSCPRGVKCAARPTGEMGGRGEAEGEEEGEAEK